MPVRSVFEAMGYIVDWQQEEQTIDIRPKYMLVEQAGSTDTVPENNETPAVILMQTIDGKPTGYSVQYFIWAAQAGSVW